jgi:hypothetical protein
VTSGGFDTPDARVALECCICCEEKCQFFGHEKDRG